MKVITPSPIALALIVIVLLSLLTVILPFDETEYLLKTPFVSVKVIELPKGNVSDTFSNLGILL